MRRADTRLQILLLCISGIVLCCAYLLWSDYQSGIRRNALQAARNAQERAALRQERRQADAQAQQVAQQGEAARLWRQAQQAQLERQRQLAAQSIAQAQAIPPAAPPSLPPPQSVPPSDLEPRVRELETARQQEEAARREWLRNLEIDRQIRSRDRAFRRDFRNFVIGGGANSHGPRGGIPGPGFVVGP